MAAVLLQVLERAELNKLPKGAQNKLEKFVTELQSASEALRTQHERFKADCEQQYFDVEKRLAESQEQIVSTTRDLQTLKEENKRLIQGQSLLFYLVYVLPCYCVCVFGSAEDVKRLNERLKETNKMKVELQLKLDSIQSSEMSIQHREKRMEQEKELLQKQTEWLNAELKTKTEELLNTNREKGKEILELRRSLDNCREQVTLLEMLCLHAACVCLQSKDQQSAMEEKYRNELNAHIKLSSLYKVRKTLLSECICCHVGVPSLTEEQLDSMCPSAAAIAQIVKPGMKFFELYNAYTECQTKLQLEKQETKRVSKVLDDIVQEVESKAPILKRQREEYESMQRSMTSLCNKLEQARMVCHFFLYWFHYFCICLSKCLLNFKCSFIHLLGSHVTKDDGSSADISSSSEVISPRQLAFRSVEELQRQNQSLLGRLRELEEERERQQSQFTSTRVSELETSNDQLQKEVEQLKEQRNQQKQLADSNARQRDMYRILLSQSGYSLPPQGKKKKQKTKTCSPDSSPQPPQLRPSVPATRSTPQRTASAESAQTAQAKAALKQLNDAFTLYKKEKGENDRLMNDTNDRLQKQLTELRSSKAKLVSQLDFSNKRYEMLNETASAYRREISALQDRNHKMTATAQQHEDIIHTMNQDLQQANEKLALLEVRVENLTKERDMLKEAESRLSQEKEAIAAEQRNQNLLLTNLKTIQLTMERTETETRQRMNSQIEHLEAELATMKTKLDREVEQRHALGRDMDAQLLEAKKQLETQNTLQQKTRELLRSSEQQVAVLKVQLSSASSEAITTTATPSNQELAEVKSRLCDAEEQKSELAEQLKNANTTVEKYKAVVLTLEDSLKKEKQARSPLEVRLKQSEDVQKQLEKRIIEVEKEKQQEREERRKAVDAVEKQVCELKRSLKSSQTDQQEALERATAAVTQEQKATQDSLLQTKLAMEAQAKYERELMLHAADVEALQEVKKQLQHEAERKKELEEHLNKTSSLLQEKNASWTALERQLKDDVSNQRRRSEELVKQNALLHQQMDEMASRSQEQQKQQQQQQHQLNVSFSEEGKTTEQLLEILRFVRREKEIAVAQCEASDGEALRHRQRVEHQEKELKDFQEVLNTERAKMQATVKTLSEKEEQLKRLDNINTLQEANRRLKMDRDKMEQELQQAQAKVTKLQVDISPLQDSLAKLSERNGSLQADKRILEDDLKRLQTRVQQLVSQQKDSNIEERQKLASEREAQQRRIAQLNTNTDTLKDSVARLTSERDMAKKDLETKSNDLVEKNKTITQVKKIGRRYKTQYEELKAQHDKLKSSQSQAQARQNQIQQLQRELQQAKETLQQNLTNQKELQQTQLTSQQSYNQEVNTLKTSLSQSESKVRWLLSISTLEEQLRQQMADKEEKTKKAFLGAKTKINQLNSAKEQLCQEIEELKQCKEEQEVRLNALKSQYEGRLLRLDRELKEMRETQTHSDCREEAQDQSASKPRSADQRQISLKNPAQDRGSSSLSDPPTANIRPTPSTPSPSSKPSPSPGNKATPRASIRPMVTPATVSMPTPTATVMPTTQTDSQEEEEGDDEDDEDAGDGGMGRGEESNEGSPEAEDDEENEEEEASEDTNAEETLCGASSDSHQPSEPSHSSKEQLQLERSDYFMLVNFILQMTLLLTFYQINVQKYHLKQANIICIQVPVQQTVDCSSHGPSAFVFQQHFFDDDDRMVPSTPTLVVPHRTDGFAEAIHSPQVAGERLSTRFRFGPPEDLLPQTSASHSDLGQLASQGGLGMYESPLFLAAHEEEGGGRSVPTTPLQVAAPVTVFTESLPSDSSDNMASQSVPMVTASTGITAATDDGDEVFMEQEGEGQQTDMEPTGQQSDDTALPSTSQDLGNFFCFLCTSTLQCALDYFGPPHETSAIISL
uniref:Translocated promoter region, nuclear basket protein n=1 Tax=Myripristis murdjan TaxID=586833 RepID=A0A668ATS4_9TELE